jgi:hypothetical protein
MSAQVINNKLKLHAFLEDLADSVETVQCNVIQKPLVVESCANLRTFLEHSSTVIVILKAPNGERLMHSLGETHTEIQKLDIFRAARQLFVSTPAQGTKLQDVQRNNRTYGHVLRDVLKSTALRTSIPFVHIELRAEMLAAAGTLPYLAETFLSSVLALSTLESENPNNLFCTKRPRETFILHLHANTNTTNAANGLPNWPARASGADGTSQPTYCADLLVCAKISILEVWPALRSALLVAGQLDT